MPRLPKMSPCPFCRSTNLKRDSWGEGHYLTVHRYVGEIKCRSCGGMMRAEFFPLSETTGSEGHAEARRLATERWNRRAGEEQTMPKKGDKMSDSVTKSENVTASGGHRDAITASASPRPWHFNGMRPTIYSDEKLPNGSARVVLDIETDHLPLLPCDENDRQLIADIGFIVDAVNERDRLRDIVRRMEDNLARYHLIGARDRALLREARAALGEGSK